MHLFYIFLSLSLIVKYEEAIDSDRSAAVTTVEGLTVELLFVYF